MRSLCSGVLGRLKWYRHRLRLRVQRLALYWYALPYRPSGPDHARDVEAWDRMIENQGHGSGNDDKSPREGQGRSNTRHGNLSTRLDSRQEHTMLARSRNRAAAHETVEAWDQITLAWGADGGRVRVAFLHLFSCWRANIEILRLTLGAMKTSS